MQSSAKWQELICHYPTERAAGQMGALTRSSSGLGQSVTTVPAREGLPIEHQSLLGAGRCVHAAYRCPLREFLVFQQSSLTCEKRLPQSQCLLPDKGETHGGLGQRARGCKQGPFSFAWELITALASTRAQHPAATPTFPLSLTVTVIPRLL